ncbi:hypothetical protein RUM44_001229 [Polyplax serrata]|uniref:Uncharacterized protein n=1 Tax=Polyplax serrata TaxID=468196 RepID=A0ABR1AJF1_POLSC
MGSGRHNTTPPPPHHNYNKGPKDGGSLPENRQRSDEKRNKENGVDPCTLTNNNNNGRRERAKSNLVLSGVSRNDYSRRFVGSSLSGTQATVSGVEFPGKRFEKDEGIHKINLFTETEPKCNALDLPKDGSINWTVCPDLWQEERLI